VSRRRPPTSNLVRVLGRAYQRIPQAIGALVQGAIYLPLMTLCAAVLGACVGLVVSIAYAGTELLHGAVWAFAGCGALGGLVLGFLSLPLALGAPLGLDAFLTWFLTGPLLEEIAISIGVVFGFLAARFDLSTDGWGCMIGVFVAIIVTACADVLLCGLFQDPLEPKTVEGEELGTFAEIKRQALRGGLLGRVARGPAPARRAATWREALKRWRRQQQKTRGKFYAKIHVD
jgi:hypothetical protein